MLVGTVAHEGKRSRLPLFCALVFPYVRYLVSVHYPCALPSVLKSVHACHRTPCRASATAYSLHPSHSAAWTARVPTVIVLLLGRVSVPCCQVHSQACRTPHGCYLSLWLQCTEATQGQRAFKSIVHFELAFNLSRRLTKEPRRPALSTRVQGRRAIRPLQVISPAKASQVTPHPAAPPSAVRAMSRDISSRWDHCVECRPGDVRCPPTRARHHCSRPGTTIACAPVPCSAQSNTPCCRDSEWQPECQPGQRCLD